MIRKHNFKNGNSKSLMINNYFKWKQIKLVKRFNDILHTRDSLLP